jgi:hypothetical protein
MTQILILIDGKVYQLSALAILLVIGCNSRSHDATERETAATTRTRQERLTESVVRPGWGVDACHLGMSVDECISAFGDPDEVRTTRGDRFADGTMTFHKHGLMIAYRDDAVVQVLFWYQSDEYVPFRGGPGKQLESNCSIADVTEQFGKPASVSVTDIISLEEWNKMSPEVEYYDGKYRAGKQERTLYYPEKGIDFTFLDGALEVVRVYEENLFSFD